MPIHSSDWRSYVFAGCDISLGMLQQAKARLANLQVVAADAPALPFKSETFDVVTASFVLRIFANK